MIDHWYITVEAVHDFQWILGLPQAKDGPLFDRAAKELAKICEGAVLKREAIPPSYTQQWQAKTKIGGKSTRLELAVSTRKRPEGDAPQLVRVRNRGSQSKGAAQKNREQFQQKHGLNGHGKVSPRPQAATQSQSQLQPQAKPLPSPPASSQDPKDPARQFVYNDQGVHLLHPCGERTLCGDVSEGDPALGLEPCMPAKSRVVSCKRCAEVIELCRGVEVKGAG